ncbi:MAG: flagellar protein [Anaerolineales bacterium]|jgi:flagellar operon protein|nr:flagellar protein [Anaerolineales bacterium]
MTKPVEFNPKVSGITNQTPAPQSAHCTTEQASGQSFAEILDLKFSKHAQNRLQARQITLDDEGLARLAAAVDKVEKRGGQESLVLMDDLAFIVNVPERMVVTAMDANKRGEGVFTQIDSVVLADSD